MGSAQGPTGLGKYLMRSPTGEVLFGGETMRFLKMVGKKNAPGFNSISGWLVLMQKRQNGIGFPEGLVFLVEMGWSSNSRDAV